MKLARVRHFERNVAGGAAAAADFFVHLLATYGEEKGVDVADEIEELRWIDSSCPDADLSVTGVMILRDLKAKGLVS